MGITNSGSQETICNEFLSLASYVIKTKQCEGSCRSAISRAYYAVFLTARDRLFGPDESRLTKPKKKKLRKSFKKSAGHNPGSHELVIFAIADLNIKGPIRPIMLSKQMNQLREARIHADYHFTQDNLSQIPYNTWEEYAEQNIKLATKLLEVAKSLPSHT